MIQCIVDLANQGAANDGWIESPPDGVTIGDGLGNVRYQWQLTPAPDKVAETPSPTAQAIAVTGDTSGKLWVRLPSKADQNAVDISATNDRIDDEISDVNTKIDQKAAQTGTLYEKKKVTHLDLSNVVFHTVTSGTVNVVLNAVNVFTPSTGASIGSLTVNIPAGVAKDGILLVFTQAITTLSWTGSPVRNTTTGPSAKSNRFIFFNTTQWE